MCLDLAYILFYDFLCEVGESRGTEENGRAGKGRVRK
jgi:hypothetical protein